MTMVGDRRVLVEFEVVAAPATATATAQEPMAGGPSPTDSPGTGDSVAPASNPESPSAAPGAAVVRFKALAAAARTSGGAGDEGTTTSKATVSLPASAAEGSPTLGTQDGGEVAAGTLVVVCDDNSEHPERVVLTDTASLPPEELTRRVLRGRILERLRAGDRPSSLALLDTPVANGTTVPATVTNA